MGETFKVDRKTNYVPVSVRLLGRRPHEAAQPQRQQVLPEPAGRGGPGRPDGRRGVPGASGFQHGRHVGLREASC